MDYGSETARLTTIIQEGRGAADAEAWRLLKGAAQAWKPEDYDAHQVLLRLYYEGKIEAHLREAARARFEMTGEKMPMAALNWARLFAENGASVYDQPAQRYITRWDKRIDAKEEEEEDSAPESDDVASRVKRNVAESKRARESIPTDDDRQRAADFAEMLEEAQIDVIMAEAERRCVLARTIFLYTYSDGVESAATGEPPKTKVVPYWPNDVLIIPHPRCPVSLQTAASLMARVASEDGVRGRSTTWMHWYRSWVDDETGMPTFGRWRAERITEVTKTTRNWRGAEQTEVEIDRQPILWRSPDGGTSEEYLGERLPWVVWHWGVPEGCPFLDADRNLVNLFDTVNTTIMSELFAVDMCAAPILVRQTDNVSTPSKVAIGPGVMTTIPRADTIASISQTTAFEGIQGSRKNLVGLLAVTNRQPSDGFDVDRSSVPQSGVALSILREPQRKARLEAVSRAIAVEKQLLAIMVEIHDLWRGTSIADEGIEYVMTPTDPPEYEEPEARQRRLIEQKDAGIIDEARLGVELGAYRTIEEARAEIAKIKEQKKADRTPLREQLDRFAMQRPIPPMPDDAPEKSTPDPDLRGNDDPLPT